VTSLQATKAKWPYVPLSDAVEIYDNMRKPINNAERQKRIAGKPKSALYPYYGATGQVGYIDDYLIEGEYVLLGEDGAPFLDPLTNKAYIVNGKIWVNNHAHILRSKTNNKFLCYYLNYFDYNGYVSGTTRLKLTQREMNRIPVPVPSRIEQEAIVAKIEELFSELDKAVEALETIQQQLIIYRNAVLKEAFEGKWKYIQRKNLSRKFETRRIPDRFLHDAPTIPSEWNYVYLSDLGELARGRSKHRPRNDPSLFENGKYPFFQTGDIKSAKKSLVKSEKMYGDFGLSQSKLWPAGTLCITIAANIAETCYLGVDGCFPDSVVGFTPKSEIINIEYIRYFVEASKKRLWAFAPATAQKNINLTTLENLMIPYCNLDEQQYIVSGIDSRLSVCDSIEQTVSAALRQAAALRQSILKQAFEGKLIS
jgi:type I restriction enzyme S subunit